MSFTGTFSPCMNLCVSYSQGYYNSRHASYAGIFLDKTSDTLTISSFELCDLLQLRIHPWIANNPRIFRMGPLSSPSLAVANHPLKNLFCVGFRFMDAWRTKSV